MRTRRSPFNSPQPGRLVLSFFLCLAACLTTGELVAVEVEENSLFAGVVKDRVTQTNIDHSMVFGASLVETSCYLCPGNWFAPIVWAEEWGYPVTDGGLVFSIAEVVVFPPGIPTGLSSFGFQAEFDKLEPFICPTVEGEIDTVGIIEIVWDPSNSYLRLQLQVGNPYLRLFDEARGLVRFVDRNGNPQTDLLPHDGVTTVPVAGYSEGDGVFTLEFFLQSFGEVELAVTANIQRMVEIRYSLWLEGQQTLEEVLQPIPLTFMGDEYCIEMVHFTTFAVDLPTPVAPGIDYGCPLPPPPPDQDQDGVPDELDNCPGVPNPQQGDLDEDGIGDVCDSNIDPSVMIQIVDDLQSAIQQLNLRVSELEGQSLEHTHMYLTGRGAGHNAVSANTGPAVPIQTP